MPTINTHSMLASQAREQQRARLKTEWHKNDGTAKANSFGIRGKFSEPVVTMALSHWADKSRLSRATKQGTVDSYFERRGERFTYEVKTSLQGQFVSGLSEDEALKELRKFKTADFMVFDTANLFAGCDYDAIADAIAEGNWEMDWSTVRVAKTAEFVDAMLEAGLLYTTAPKRLNGRVLVMGPTVYEQKRGIVNKGKYPTLLAIIAEHSVPWDEFYHWRWSRTAE